MKNLKVYKEIYENEQIFIVNDEDIEKGCLHNTYNQYGQKVGHTYACDYSLHNNEGTWAFEEMRKEGVDKFGEGFFEIEIDTADLSVQNYDDLKEEGIEVSEKELNEWIKEWEKKNANYTCVEHITWWNGNNYQSHVLEDEEYGATLKRVDEDLEKSILAAYEEAEDWEDSRCRVGGYTFKTTRYPHFYVAKVVIGEDEDE